MVLLHLCVAAKVHSEKETKTSHDRMKRLCGELIWSCGMLMNINICLSDSKCYIKSQ